MRIVRLDLERFRHFRESSLSLAGARGLTVVYGPNEAGKTTVLEAVRCFLFGFRDKSGDLTVDYEQSELKVGALLELDNGKKLVATRTKGRKQTLFGRAVQGGEEFIGEKLRNAQWLIRAIEQRRKTIIRVTECIVEKQRDFFERGVAFLKPMILRDVADSVGMHESTISRVTTNKYVHTPQGLFELKYFFNSSIRRTAEDDIASESVKQAIKKIIEGEDKSNPLSDQAIVEILAADNGIQIARRTVAKYREMLGILASSKRKKLF